MPKPPRIVHGDCLEIMKMLPDKSVDSIVTDPPYGLGFMGKAWDKLHENPARSIGIAYSELQAALEAAAPYMAAQAITEAVDAFPLETITAPDNAVAWLRPCAEETAR